MVVAAAAVVVAVAVDALGSVLMGCSAARTVHTAVSLLRPFDCVAILAAAATSRSADAAAALRTIAAVAATTAAVLQAIRH